MCFMQILVARKTAAASHKVKRIFFNKNTVSGAGFTALPAFAGLLHIVCPSISLLYELLLLICCWQDVSVIFQ